MYKQAVTFLSLFSLILVLSVYYIMLPPVDDVVNNANIVSTSTVDFDMMQQQLTEKRESIIKENNDIIANASSSAQEVAQALEMIEVTKSLSETENEVKEQLKTLGYEEAFVEIDGSTMKVNIRKTESCRN